MTDYSDFIVYADESGSPNYSPGDPEYPIFVLAFVLVKKAVFSDQIVPRIQKLKFDLVGHDQIIFHERDIRKQIHQFSFLRTDKAVREKFLNSLNEAVEECAFEIVSTVVFKKKIQDKYASPWSPYEIALYLSMERLLSLLRGYGQKGKRVHVVFESRGKVEDRELELHFRRVANNEDRWGHKKLDFTIMDWEPVFVDKKSNSVGLQFADLVARPLGLKMLRPEQKNRAYDALAGKIPHNCFKHFP